MTTLTTQKPLVALAFEINTKHELCKAAAQTAIEHARDAGRLLLEAKAQVPQREARPSPPMPKGYGLNND